MSREPTRAAILIRESRKRAGLTQQALAEKLGITTSAVCNYESGAQVSPKQRWSSVFVIFLTLRPATCSSVNKFFLTRQLLDKRSASNFCIKDGLTTSILLKNGIELRFSYKTSE